MNAVYTNDVTKEVLLVSKWKLPFIVAWNKIWNVCRRPLVKMWQQDVLDISYKIKARLASELLPFLYDNMRAGCSECSFLYSFLKGQPFTSQIEQALLHSRCSKHFVVYQQFYVAYEHYFLQSHELSDKVCGFKSNRK